MIVQIYTMQTAAEAQAIAALGVDHIGITPSNRGLPGEVTLEAAREIFAAVKGQVVRVALSVEPRVEDILDMVSVVQPDILHLCGDITIVTPEVVADIRAKLPGVGIMQAVPMVDRGAVDIALAYQPVSDYLILDSQSPDIGGIGAAGFTHDWNISREIVQRVGIPVILAGGLHAGNVAEAIRAVQPWGVDSLTRTNLPLGGGKFRKDLDAVRAFVEAAKENQKP